MFAGKIARLLVDGIKDELDGVTLDGPVSEAGDFAGGVGRLREGRSAVLAEDHHDGAMAVDVGALIALVAGFALSAGFAFVGSCDLRHFVFGQGGEGKGDEKCQGENALHIFMLTRGSGVRCGPCDARY